MAATITLRRYFNFDEIPLSTMIDLKPSKMTKCTEDCYSFLMELKSKGVKFIYFNEVVGNVYHSQSTIYRSLAAIHKLWAEGTPKKRLYSSLKQTERTNKKYEGPHTGGLYSRKKDGTTIAPSKFADSIGDYKTKTEKSFRFAIPSNININNNIHKSIFDRFIHSHDLSMFHDNTGIKDSLSASDKSEDGTLSITDTIPTVQTIWEKQDRVIPGKPTSTEPEEDENFDAFEEMVIQIIREQLPAILEEILPTAIVKLHKKQLEKTPKPSIISDIKPSVQDKVKEELAKAIKKVEPKEVEVPKPNNRGEQARITNYCELYANKFLSATKSRYGKPSPKDRNCMKLAIEFYGDKFEDALNWLFDNYRTFIDGYPSIGVFWGFRLKIMAGLDGVKRKDGGISQWDAKAAEERAEKYAGMDEGEAQLAEYLEWAEKN